MKNHFPRFFTTTAVAAVILCAAAQNFPALAQTTETYKARVDAYLAEIEALRPLAEKGDAAAQFRLGRKIERAPASVVGGLEKKWQESVRWYRKAAEQGYTRAEYLLGVSYAIGLGVAENRLEALRWYRKAAEKGYSPAQYALGNAYATGNGIRMDKQEAVRLWRESAEQGYVEAQHKLGQAYMTLGQGVGTDELEAYIWFSIAAANGMAASIRILNNDWSNYLSRSEIRSARKKAEKRLKNIDRRTQEHDKKFDLLR